jgi:hypothetical protein
MCIIYLHNNNVLVAYKINIFTLFDYITHVFKSFYMFSLSESVSQSVSHSVSTYCFILTTRQCSV